MSDFTILRKTRDEEAEQDYAVLGLSDIHLIEPLQPHETVSAQHGPEL
jgi:hypothetical protein